jgi:DNA replication protein DnaC
MRDLYIYHKYIVILHFIHVIVDCGIQIIFIYAPNMFKQLKRTNNRSVGHAIDTT